jgi:hypothetical protein
VAVHGWLLAMLLMWRSDSRRRASVSRPGRKADFSAGSRVFA